MRAAAACGCRLDNRGTALCLAECSHAVLLLLVFDCLHRMWRALEVDLHHTPPVALAYGDDVVLDARLFALFGQMSDEMCDVSANRAHVLAFQFEADEVFQLIE